MKTYIPNILFVVATFCFAHTSLLLAFLFASSITLTETYTYYKINANV